MNKNLKKVISAVAALALSVSSFTALAANYPDVPADANYKHAIDELTALEIVDGIEENGVINFKPDEQVTRAQFSTMVVRALARGRAAESAAGQTTMFTDVNDAGAGAKHWASGYIVTLTGMGIINGYGDGTFKPDNTVSYAEAMKMLACAAGYDTWAQQKGGWPNGYLAQANDLGIGDGVVVESNDTPLTREQCAQMVANAIKAPVLIETGETSWNGTKVTEQKNGTGRGYQTILTKNHDAYEVYGRVTETSKTASGGMDADEVRFQVERATNFENEYFPRNSVPTDFVANVGDTDAANQLKVYSEAIVKVDDNGEYNLICLSPLSENAEITFAAADFDDENRYYEQAGNDYASTGRLYAYVNGSTRTTSYKLATTSDGQLDNISLYVNGVDVTGSETLNSFIDKYIVGNEVGEVTLVSESSIGSTATSGTYNTVMVTNYYDAVVESVEERGDFVDIYLSYYEIGLGNQNKLTIDTTDEDVDYSFVKSGAEIQPNELQPYDIISIAYDVTGRLADSAFYDVKVSDKDIYEGKYTQYRDNRDKGGKWEYQIDGTWYEAVEEVMPEIGLSDRDDRYNTYTFYFDYFGRVAYAEEGTSDKNIAIVENIYPSTDGETQYVKLIYKDGTNGSVAISDSLWRNEKFAQIDGKDVTVEAYINYILRGVATTTEAAKGYKKLHPYKRVVTYRTNSSNELTAISALNSPGGSGDDPNATYIYRESTNKLGGYALSDATTALVVSEDGSGWDISKLDISTLIDDDEYRAWFFDRSNSSGIYSFVMVEDNSGNINSKSTRMAVYMSEATTSDENYDKALELLVPGSDEAVQVFVSDDYTADVEDAVSGLDEGTPIIYSVDSVGAIKSVQKVMNVPNTYSDLVSTLQTPGTDLKNLVGLINFSNKGDNVSFDKQYEIVFGLISMKSGNSLDFVTKYDTHVAKKNNVDVTIRCAADTVNNISSYTMTDETSVYVYDYNGRTSHNDRILKGSIGSVRDTQVPSRAWGDDNHSLIDMDYDGLSPRYAVARILGDEVMEIMVFVPENF